MATEMIHDPMYWRQRLNNIPSNSLIHQAIFKCQLDKWKTIESKHKEILSRHIELDDSILDVGCAWGRLLDLLPFGWMGFYVGLDISPDFLDLARTRHPCRVFMQQDIINPSFALGDKIVDWAVLISFRPMIIRNQGADKWEKALINIKRISRKILYLEYDEKCEGEVVEC